MSKINSKSDLSENFKWFCDTWLSLKKKAKETDSKDDWEFYEFFLKEARKSFTKVYVGMINKVWIELMENIFKTISCQLKEINIKYKKVSMSVPIQMFEVSKMTDQELLDLYKKGSKWLTDHMQVSDTNKNELGETITSEMFKQWEKGLHKLEKVVIEMNKRGIVYG